MKLKSMLCPTCKTYSIRLPCPQCARQNPSRIVNKIDKSKTLIQRKIFLLSSTPEELDFFWAQFTQPGKDVQRVQRGGSILRQGFLTAEMENHRVQIEFIGSTFTQGFPRRIEKLYPGVDHIFIIADTNNQQFRRDALEDIFDDLANVNRHRLLDIRFLWLTYPNSNNETQLFKDELKTWFNDYITNLRLNKPVEDIELPIYPGRRFIEQLSLLLNNITELDDFAEQLHLPLRPLFRIRPHLDQLVAQPRVIILELDPVATPEPVRSIFTGEKTIQNVKEKFKCIACGNSLTSTFMKCIKCNSAFCTRCMNLIEFDSSESSGFCLGSIYFGLHKQVLRKMQ